MLQVTRVKEPTSILNSTTEVLSTINNTLLEATSQAIDLCTHHMVQRVIGKLRLSISDKWTDAD